MIQSRVLAETAIELSRESDGAKRINGFIEYLKKNNLIGLLPQVLAHIERLQSKTSEEETLHIYSKHKLSAKEVKDIQSTTGAKDAPVEQHIDDAVVGGFSATYRGYIYDGSLKTQVTRLKTMLTR